MGTGKPEDYATEENIQNKWVGEVDRELEALEAILASIDDRTEELFRLLTDIMHTQDVDEHWDEVGKNKPESFSVLGGRIRAKTQLAQAIDVKIRNIMRRTAL